MHLMKSTYSLPSETLEQFEQVVAPGKRSTIVAQLLREWVENQRREGLTREVIEGCREMADLYRQIEREYHPLEEEVARARGD